MKTLQIMPLLLLFVFTANRPCSAQAAPDLSVISFRWSRYVKALNEEPKWGGGEMPSRQQQINDKEKAMVEKNYGDLLRSQALRKIERDAARSAVEGGDIFMYEVKVHNSGTKTIKNIFWEYQIIETANPANLSSRQFFCGLKIKANDRRDLQALSLAAPMTNIISVKTLKGSKKSFEERAIVNRIEYVDKSLWQRDGWNFPNPTAAALPTLKRDPGESVCRGL
jgi:hypothetical protein